MEERKKSKPGFISFSAILCAYIAMLMILVFTYRGIDYTPAQMRIRLLDDAEYRTALRDRTDSKPDTLIVYNESDSGKSCLNLMKDVLNEMAVAFDTEKVSDFESEMTSDYTKIVLAVSDMTGFGDDLPDLFDWVANGNSLMFAITPEYNGMFQIFMGNLGILQIGEDYTVADTLHFTGSWMPGASSRDYPLMDAFDSAMTVILDNECDVLVETGGERSAPVFWQRDYKKGNIVFCNLNIFDKAYRGLYCAAYSMLGESCAWPIINGAVFYIDDFPSPVPEGNNSFITDTFHMSVEEFYTRHWWKDVSSLSEKYGILYTGLVIEDYSDQVAAPYVRNTLTDRFRLFGGTLLKSGGEIGFHGYNHMPLVLQNFDYRNEFPSYVQWASYEDMKQSVVELKEFCTELFPELRFQVYVPPSNILSKEGLKMLTEDFEDVRSVASVYITDDNGLEFGQEFTVDENGMIYTPRIVSGYIFEDFSRLAALSELTMHGASSHFQHPDDVMDEDRGAALGWTEMFSRFSDYCGWLYDALPEIRNLRGSEFAAAVQRYKALSVQQENSEHEIRIHLGGFVDEAWLYVRINGGTPGNVEGGSLEKAADDLYLLKAESDEIVIHLDETGGGL